MIGDVPIGEYTPEALLGIVVLLIFLGRLVPAWYVKQLESRVDSLEEANKELIDQNSELLETTRLARSTWLALAEGTKES